VDHDSHLGTPVNFEEPVIQLNAYRHAPAKLKRLVSRGALRGDGPGLFALATESEQTPPR